MILPERTKPARSQGGRAAGFVLGVPSGDGFVAGSFLAVFVTDQEGTKRYAFVFLDPRAVPYAESSAQFILSACFQADEGGPCGRAVALAALLAVFLRA